MLDGLDQSTTIEHSHSAYARPSPDVLTSFPNPPVRNPKVNITVMARHLPGVQNESADALSHNKLSVYFRRNPQVSSPGHNSEGATGADIQQVASVDVTRLDGAVQHYIESCVAPPTCSAYGTAHCQHTAFCGQLQMCPHTLSVHSLRERLHHYQIFYGVLY